MPSGLSKAKRPNPDLLARRLSRLATSGHVAQLIPSVSRLAREYPGHAGLNQALSEILAAAQEFDQAVVYARVAARLDPDNPKRAIHLALCLIATHQDAAARDVLDGAAKRLPESAASLAMLASIFVRANDNARAATLYECAIELEPDNAGLHFSLAAVRRFLGDLEAAERSCDDAIARNPREYEAYLIRADLRMQTAARNHIAEIEALLARPIDSYVGEVMLCHAVAKECEDVGQHRKSFQHLDRGAKLRRRHLSYDVADDLSVINEIIRCFDDSILSGTGKPGFRGSAPIFVIGMPRTGTTLVERILGGHSKICSLGELPDFPRLTAKVGRTEVVNGKITKLELVRRSIRIDMAELGRSYMANGRALASDSVHFVDKLPFNYLNVGLIHLALPDAKIIHVTRDPMDTCYAIYKTLFRNAYPFSYSFDDLGAYYIAYSKLMQHWRTVLPERMLEVRYESLVQRTESECRRLIAHCGVDWESGVLGFHDRAEVSMTASASQVRRPVYTSSIGKWMNYAVELRPLTRILRDSGIEMEWVQGL